VIFLAKNRIIIFQIETFL